ncbi:hypothetical protein ACFY9N_06530 [Microbacterium sp. NPDC008134]|uniref:hypothetical protein n=1 Tax=Microbacterium sp. NPDC008134 TaxID=3364183 RepID=UPI0036F1634D
MKYAYELELGVLTSNDPTRPEAIPHIVVGIGHHAPAFGPGKAARAMFENIVSRGLRLDHVIGDRAYLPGAKEADLQNYLRSAGAKLVMDYHKNFLVTRTAMPEPSWSTATGTAPRCHRR